MKDMEEFLELYNLVNIEKIIFNRYKLKKENTSQNLVMMPTGYRMYSTTSRDLVDHRAFIQKKNMHKHQQSFMIMDIQATVHEGIISVFSIGFAYKFHNQIKVEVFNRKTVDERMNVLNCIEKMLLLAKKKKINRIFMHNIDHKGICILNAIINSKTLIKVLYFIVENNIYNINIKSDQNEIGVKIIDSMKILPGTLGELIKAFEIRNVLSYSTEGYIYTSDTNYNAELEAKLINLYNIINVAQNKIYSLFQIDLARCVTIGGLSMLIYQSYFYKDKIKRLKINQDNYIRQAYIGGRCEIYKPHGYNLYAYDVNSLYPYVMKLPMPINNIKWYSNFDTKNIKNIIADKIGLSIIMRDRVLAKLTNILYNGSIMDIYKIISNEFSYNMKNIDIEQRYMKYITKDIKIFKDNKEY